MNSYNSLKFYNKEGQLLGARLEMPNSNKPRAYAIFAHCFTCSKDYKAIFHISKTLREHNIAVLRFDFTGLGESEGDFSETNIATNVDDLVAAADYLAIEFTAPKLLIGHSMGGAAVIQAAADIESVLAVATIAAPFHPGKLAGVLKSSKERIKEEGQGEVEIAGRKFTLKRQFFEKLEATNMQKAVSELNKALLVIHAVQDKTVSIENAEEIFNAAKFPKSFISLRNADHLLSNERDSRYVGNLLAMWLERYLNEH
ncbi:lysophospholipase [bacterium]|nr:lysophospholipase [bacterium]